MRTVPGHWLVLAVAALPVPRVCSGAVAIRQPDAGEVPTLQCQNWRGAPGPTAGDTSPSWRCFRILTVRTAGIRPRPSRTERSVTIEALMRYACAVDADSELTRCG